MPGESYTLREVSELLGVSKRTLQRRIQEGAFPGRFLAPGRHGLETRIPAGEVQRVLEDIRRAGSASAFIAGRAPAPSPTPVQGPQLGGAAAMVRGSEIHLPTVTPPREYAESRVALATEALPPALTTTDLESLRDAMLALVREDRESFLNIVRESVASRERELATLRAQVATLQATVEKLRRALESGEMTSRRPAPAERPAPPPPPVMPAEAESILREMDELESFLSSLSR